MTLGTDYVEQAMDLAVYDKLEDDTFARSIPPCQGVIAFDSTLRGCERELRSALEDWSFVGLKLGHPLPALAAIDLNGRPAAVMNTVGDDEDELERLLLAYSPKFQTVLRQARKQIRDTGGIRHADFWADIDEGGA